MNRIAGSDIKIILGDFNAEVGKEGCVFKSHRGHQYMWDTVGLLVMTPTA
jgi:hypothetical protein